MNRFAALHDLRIGCVRYLNAQPLIHAWTGEVTLDHPSRLAEMLARGELDVALVPVFAALRAPEFCIADGVSISARGAVFSVFLAFRGKLADVKSIALDPASRTSCHLLKCLLAEFHAMQPRFVIAPENADAQLLIGNQAIAFRQKHGAEFSYLDLGEEWLLRTRLPFVFAVWLMRPDVPDASRVANALRELKQRGLTQIDEIAKAQKDFAPEFARRYLTENIRFDLGEDEKAGITRFRELLAKYEFIAPVTADLRFV